jgi:hydrogenase nickel incorporation protein HypA/HybF
MHELAICQAIMNQVETLAKEHHANRIRSVSVRIGPLSGIEPQLLELAFPLVSAGTVAEGSQLIILHPEIRIRCPTCNTVSVATPLRLACPACSQWRTELLSGDEMLLASVEMSRG